MLYAGFAHADITPPEGLELAGGSFGPSRGLLHRLSAKAMCLQEGGARILLIACDLLGFEAGYADGIRRAIAAKSGLAREAILLTATHTHGGPATVPLRNWGTPDPVYCENLRDDLVEIAGWAVRGVQAVEIGTGNIPCPGVAVNRAAADGPTNDRLTVLRVNRPDGAPLAVVVNYACHPVNLHSTGLVTPDFPWYVEQNLRRELGTGVSVFYLTGAAGDLNPANYDPADAKSGAADGYRVQKAKAAETAAKISAKALELLPTIRTQAAGPVAWAARSVDAPLQPLPPAAELRALREERAKKLAAETDRSPSNWAYGGHKTAVEWADEALKILGSGPQQTIQRLDVQALRVGTAAFVGLPGELFAEFGVAIQRSSPFADTFVATLANGCAGYFPSRAAYAAGRYEAVHCPRYLGVYAFQPGIGEQMQTAALETLADLEPIRKPG